MPLRPRFSAHLLHAVAVLLTGASSALGSPTAHRPPAPQEAGAVADEPAASHSTVERLLDRAEADPRLQLVTTFHRATGTVVLQGRYEVFENRATGEGRRIGLEVIVLPSRADPPAPDPVFVLHGGPGAPATSLAQRLVSSWLRDSRDVVLIDQRGTGGSNPLDVAIPGDDANLQSYLESYFDVEAFRAALPGLQRRADLTQYTTPNAVDDFEELRAALGYNRINLRGGSYGTRAALVYLRRHPESVRSASLQGIQPIGYVNPLPHARGAQQALDLIFEEVESSERYRAAFPELRSRFQEILERLAEAPALVRVAHPSSGEEVEVLLDRQGFAEGVRLQLYSIAGNRRLPLLLDRAHRGDYRELVEAFIAQSRAVRDLLSWGTLIAVTESEDLWRLEPASIGPAVEGTFLGRTRIDDQLAVAAIWPSGQVPPSFAEPVRSDVPVLLWSGSHDPTTTPEWGEEAARHLPNGLHVVVPAGHGVSGPEVERVDRAFLERGSIEGLELEEVRALRLPPLVLPPG